MKNYIFALLSFLSVEISAQTGFYFRPIVEHKFHANAGPAFDLVTPQGYILKVEPINFYAQRGFDIGFYLGYRTKNFFFETGWSQDQGNQAVRVSGMSYNTPDSSFYRTELTYMTGIAYNKIPLRAGLKVFGQDTARSEKNWNWQGFLFGGMDFLIKQPGALKGGNSYDFITNKNLDTLKYEAKLGSDIDWSYMGTLGFMVKARNKNGMTLNLSLHYSQGSRYTHTAYTALTFTNYDGTVYKSFVSSKSSGVYFSISTDIYPVQLFRNNQREDVEVNEVEIKEEKKEEIKTVN